MDTPSVFWIQAGLTVPGLRMILSRNMLTRDHTCFAFPNTHDYYELFLAEQGTHYICIDHTVHCVQPGQMLLVRPHEVHYELYQPNAGPLSEYAVGLSCSGIDGSDNACSPYIQALSRFLETRCTAAQPLLFQLLADMLSEINSGLFGMQNNLSALCSLFMSCLLRGFLPQERQAEPAHRKNLHSSDLMIYLQRNFTRKLDATEMADFFHISVRYLNTLLNQSFHMPFTLLVRTMRLQAAEALLVHSEKSIQQIAASCGFRSMNYFYTSFFRKNGLSPSAFRAKYAGQRQAQAFFDIEQTSAFHDFLWSSVPPEFP